MNNEIENNDVQTPEVNENEFVAGTITNDEGVIDTVVVEPSNGYNANLRKENYKLAEAMKNNDNPFKKKFNQIKGIFGSDIGFKSSGFTQTATLAGIIALAGIIIAYLILRF